jgi:hypothetical protein
MTTSRTARAILAALALAPATALAQEPADELPGAEGSAPATGTEVELDEDPPPEDMDGVNEDPDAPRQSDDDLADVTPAAPTGYPVEEVLRPLTLPALTSEVGLEVRFAPSPLELAPALRVRFAATRQIQLGLRYAGGGVYDDPDPSTSTTFNPGKAFGLDLTYLVFDWMAARLTLPFYADPFAMGVTLGAPMKFRLSDKLALVAVDDFLDIRVAEFVPSLTRESLNEANADAAATVTTASRGTLSLRAGVIYQVRPNLAVRGNFSQSFLDFQSKDTPTGLEGLVQFSPRRNVDVIGRLGIDALDDVGDTFGLMVAAALRI